MSHIDNSNQQYKIEKTMRILANLLIDRFLEDKKNHNLNFILKRININLEQKQNYGTNK